MTYTESIDFLEKQVKSRWPEWRPTDQETKDWCGVLGYYSWDVAAGAMFNYIKDATKITKRPLIAVFITKAKLILVNRPKPKEVPFAPQAGVLYGNKAMEQAFRLILAGGDTPSRRFVRHYLDLHPEKTPAGVTLTATSEATTLPDNNEGCFNGQDEPESLGGALGAVFKKNPNWVGENPLPPEGDLPF